MSFKISRRRFVWLCMGAAGTACTVLTGCGNEVAAETSPTATSAAVGTKDSAETAPTATSADAGSQDPAEAAPAATAAAQATEDSTESFVSRCPKGLVNDPYPGRCRHYVDTNGDGICDLSQPS